MQLKRSRQRESIKNFLMTRKDHPTAEVVYTNVKKEYPNISLGTVYRNLALLTELGEIMKISTEDGPDRFDGNPLPHYHFICRKCDCVIDLDMESVELMNQKARENFSGVIEGHKAYFYGVCAECVASENQSKSQE